VEEKEERRWEKEVRRERRKNEEVRRNKILSDGYMRVVMQILVSSADISLCGLVIGMEQS
jgi:hypothetical protein